MSTGPASAAPVSIPVYQIPSTALAVSGLVVPGPYFATVNVTTTDNPAVVRFSAPASPTVCATSAAGALVRVYWVNLTRMWTGAATVKACRNYLGSTPTSLTAIVGEGRVVIHTQVIGSPLSPRAGQPSLPGVGTFTVGGPGSLTGSLTGSSTGSGS
ncbi:MAG: hypothetical protein KDB67_10765 [Gordonia sp.]|nr:hypothetical protein [Gordonia sp. (in: high G+C Gram-positive bacteria)]